VNPKKCLKMYIWLEADNYSRDGFHEIHGFIQWQQGKLLHTVS